MKNLRRLRRDLIKSHGTTEKEMQRLFFFIQSALDDEICPRIFVASTSKQAWEILKQEYFGDKKAIVVKLQTLHSSFENMTMQDKESVQNFLSRV